MNTEDVKHVVAILHDALNSPDETAKEINMWRKRFLDSLNLPNDKYRDILEYFMAIPRDAFHIYTPEEHIENLKRYCTK